MSLWNCIECGCQAIARDLGFCPACFKPKDEEMPKTTVTGGPSNVAEAAEAATATATQGQDADAPIAAPAPAPEPQAAPTDVLSELEAAAASLKRPSSAAGEG